nr:hypothetical protein [Tanacetum cinerariifolium]
ATPGQPDLPVPVPELFHEQTDEELTDTDIKRMDADDQAIKTILLGLPEDVYAAVDSCETANGNVIDKLIMLEVMVGIRSDSMLDKWHKISKDITHGRMELPIRVDMVMLLLLGLRVLEWGIKPGATTAEDWVILLGIVLPDQEEGMLLI